MRGAILPAALLAAAVGMVTSYAEPKIMRQSAAAMVVVAVAVAFIPWAGVSDDIAFNGCWVSILLTAASVHIPGTPNPWLSRGLALNAGFWAGLVTHVQGGALVVFMGLPLLALIIPGHLLVKRNWGIAIKVACSWLIAIAALEIGLMMVPTPGYAPDHMD